MTLGWLFRRSQVALTLLGAADIKLFLAPMKLLTIIVNYRTAALTVKALEALLPEMDRLPGSRAVVVENDSRDGSLDTLAAAIAAHGWGDRVHLIASPRNGGFGAGVNVGARWGLGLHPQPDYFYLLNPDAAPDPGAVVALCAFMDAHPAAGIAGSHLYTPDGKPHSSAFRFPTLLGELDQGLRLGMATRLLHRWVIPIAPSHDTVEVDWVAGASLIVRREVLAEVGLFDEGYFLYFEETDFCLRARRQGWTCWYVGSSIVGHVGGAATGFDHTGAASKQRGGARPALPRYWFDSRRRYYDKNHGALYRVATDAVFLASFAGWRARRRLQRKPESDPAGFLWDFFRYSLSSARRGSTP